jgi:hypothetical protein
MKAGHGMKLDNSILKRICGAEMEWTNLRDRTLYNLQNAPLTARSSGSTHRRNSFLVERCNHNSEQDGVKCPYNCIDCPNGRRARFETLTAVS